MPIRSPANDAGRAPSIPDEIAAAAGRHPGTAVIVHSDVNPATTTLGELYDESRRVAASLVAMGIRPGDVVAVQLPNWRECFVAHAAVWFSGGVLLPIVPIYGPHEVALILRRSGARALLIARSHGNRDCAATLAATSEMSHVAHRIVVGEPTSGTVPFDALTRADANDFAVQRPSGGEQRCLLVYTSGTTAEPKGVQHTHASLLSELRAMDQLRGTRPTPTSLAVFPSGHIAGVLGILRTLVRATATVAMDAWNPRIAARLIAEHQVGVSAGAPIHLGGILDAAEQERLDLSSMREYTTGAAGVAGSLIRRADTWGIGAFRCYGSTEHPTISSSAAEDPLHKRADTDGRISPGTEIRLVDDDGCDVLAGCDGEILSRGPELFAGYADLRHTRTALAGGWFHTGDVGRLDRDGYLTITDRKKDIIVRGGENISSKEVEDIVSNHPAVAEAAALGAPDDKYGERVCVFVVVNSGHEFGTREAAEHFQQCGLARQKTPERVVVVDELPRTASGKVQKHLLRRQLEPRMRSIE